MDRVSHPFSALDRSAILQQFKRETFDLIVIGGGITGAGIALDAAARGLKTALVEKKDFAFGTSSRSTKLIHGGLRYLKELEFALVHEVGSERAIVHGLAPHLVVPEKMLLPLYEKRGMGYGLTSIGLKIYDWLAGVKQEDRRKMLTRQQTIAAEPLLKKDDIKGGGLYAEYRTDDARLTIEVVKLAVEKGAVISNYVSVQEFLYTEDIVSGVIAKDELTGATFEVNGRAIVNAAGPWVDELRAINKSKTLKHLHLTKGVHIVVPFHRLPVRQSIYFDVPDGRMIFAIPRGRVTYVGTTDTDYTGEKDQVFTSREDARYLVDAVNATFPEVHLTLADIESSWAGLRPLIHEEGKSASELSRKDEIFDSPSELISIAGGKLTGYRKMAERVVDHVIKKKFSDRTFNECTTESMLLISGGMKSVAEVQQYNHEVALRADALGLKGGEGSYLVHMFGSNTTSILDQATANKTGDPELDLALAMLSYCAYNEMIVNAEDFLVRRTGLLYFNIHRLEKIQEVVLKGMAHLFSWNEEQLVKERDVISDLIQKTLNFKN